MDSPTESGTDCDSLESDSEECSFEKKLELLKFLSVQENQIKISLEYEKNRKEFPLIEDVEELFQKNSALETQLREIKNEQNMADVLCTNQQLIDTWKEIVSPNNGKAKQSRYSEDQTKCIRDMLKQEKLLKKQITSKQSEILSLEEQMETFCEQEVDFKMKRNVSGYSSNDNKNEGLEGAREKNRHLAQRIQQLAWVIHSLMKRHPRIYSEGLKPTLKVSRHIMESFLDHSKVIHSLLCELHELNIKRAITDLV